MFNNRKLEIRVAKDNTPNRPTVPAEKPFYQNPDELRKIGKELTKGIVVVIAAVKILDTLSQVTINACDNQKKED